MSTNEETLKTAAYIDLVDVGLCLLLYNLCNGELIESTSKINFVNWLNLKPTNPPIKFRSREKTRCCYMIKQISDHLLAPVYKEAWIEKMLKSLGISQDHYNKHRQDVIHDRHIEKNKELIKGLDDACRGSSLLKDFWLQVQTESPKKDNKNTDAK